MVIVVDVVVAGWSKVIAVMVVELKQLTLLVEERLMKGVDVHSPQRLLVGMTGQRGQRLNQVRLSHCYIPLGGTACATV